MLESAILHTKTETSQLLAKARSCASRNLGLGGRHPRMMRSAWERVHTRTSTASASRTSLRLEGSGTAPTASRLDSTASPATKSVSMASLASQRLRLRPHRHSGARLIVIICHQVTHFIVTWRRTTASLRGASCDTGGSSVAKGPPQQGRNNTLRS